MSPPVETRQQKAERQREEDLRRLEQIDEEIAIRRRMIADHALPFRRRMSHGVSVRLLRISRAFLRGSLNLSKSDLTEEPTFSQRYAAAAREEMRASERSRHLSQAAILDSEIAKRRPVLMATMSSLIGWAIICSVIAVDYLIFRLLFDVNYFSWYVENGAVINIFFTFISLAVVLDAYTGLISSNPLRYLWACMALVNHLGLAWDAVSPDENPPSSATAAREKVVAATQAASSSDEERTAPVEMGAYRTADGTWLLPTLFDSFISLIVFIAMALATFGWLLIVAPVQYLAFAVLGAPARNVLRGKTVAAYDPVTDTTEMGAPVGRAHSGFEIGYRNKPVSLTAALAATVFWVISAL